MYRWSNIPEEHRPAIISDISDNKLYTIFINRFASSGHQRQVVIHRADNSTIARYNSRFVKPQKPAVYATDIAWEGSSRNPTFKNIIDNNIPCVIAHKVKNEWAPAIDTIVCFMTDDAYDVFLIHSKDLMEWNPSEES